MRALAWMAVAGLLAGSLTAADRPSDADLFGGGASTTAVADPAATGADAPAPAAKREASDAAELSHAEVGRDLLASGATVDNPLTLGGLYYQQASVSPYEGYEAGSSALAAPLLFDGFMDSRPTERLRGYLRIRLNYDPTLAAGAASLPTAASLSPTAGRTPTPTPNPQVQLDQAWLKFDLGQAVFVTAGRQHVKWGVGHYWNPNDLLTAQKLDPQAVIDQRLGMDMLRLTLPLPASSALTAAAVFDGTNAQLGGVGGAFRAETNFGSHAEVGVDMLTQAGAAPHYGADVSFPLGPLDAYAEAGLMTGGYSLPTLSGDISPGVSVTALIGQDSYAGPLLQAVAGASYDFAWRENRQATVGAEYFYNSLGSQNGNAYPVLLFEGRYQPYYLGRHYVAGFLSAEGPDEAKHSSYNLSTICNLTDGSLQTRLDLQWAVDTYLTWGAWVDAHYGTRGGEFNFAVDTPTLTYNGAPVAYHVPRTVADAGLSLRLGF